MKPINLFIVLLMFVSCKENHSASLRDTQHIPVIFTAASSPGLSIKNDTVFLDGKLYSGFLYALHANNKDSISFSGYSNGLLQGVAKKWFSNKQLMEERYYDKGKKNGHQVSWWENGNKRFEFMAKDDAYEGELKEWTIDGKLIHLAHFKKGQEEGSQQLWYDNGKIRANYVIINGRRYGLLGTKNCRNVSDSIFAVR